MTDLTEKALLDALIEIEKWGKGKLKFHPRRLIVTEAGIAWQARNYKDGVITEEDMRAADIPQALIDEVKSMASEIK